MLKAMVGIVLTAICLTLGSAPAGGATIRHATAAQGGGGGVPAFQQAVNRQYKSMNFTYSRLCPSCSDERWYTDADFPKATGKVHVDLASFVIPDENDRYDFFLVDATATLTDRTGDEDWGWMDLKLQSVGRTKVLSSSYTLGKDNQNTSTCKRYPVSLGVGFFGVSAGTVAGHISICNKGSKVASSTIERGRLYHATGVSGLAMVQMQRYVRVRDGALPQFRLTVGRNTEGANCATVSDGFHCWINRGFQTSSRKIGTSRQR